MAIYHVFEVPLLFFNFLAIQKGALAECSFGFSIQLMFFVKFCMSTLPPFDQSESSRQLSSKSDDFRPIRELFLSQVAIIVQSESSCHHMWRLSTNQRALDTNKQLTSVTKNTIMVFKIKKILWDLSRKMQSTFLYSTWISLEQWHLEDEINCHQFQVFLKIQQILKTRWILVEIWFHEIFQ